MRVPLLLSIRGLLVLFSMLLAACGGGGGESAAPHVLPLPAPQPALRYAALGDSITTAKDLANASLAYPFILGSLLQTSLLFSSVHVDNLSVGGMHVSEVITAEVPQIDPSTDLVTLMIGHNDIWAIRDEVHVSQSTADAMLASVNQAYVELIAGIRAQAPHARIIISNIRHLDAINATPHPDLDYVIDRMDAMIAALQGPGVSVLDLACGFADQYEQSLFTDWVHMTAQGHKDVAGHFYSAYAGSAPGLAASCSPIVTP